MPTNFLTQDQKENYGKFPKEIDEYDLAKYFLLDERDLEFIEKKRGLQNRFGFALQITSIRFLGMSFNDLEKMPYNAKRFVANQIDVNNIKILGDYGKRDVTKREHLAEIKAFYDYSDLSEGWLFRINRMIYYKVWIGDEKPSVLFDNSVSWLLQNKILLPGITTLERIIARIRDRIYGIIWKSLSDIPSNFQKKRLNSLISIKKNSRYSNLDNYRKGPVHVSSNSINDQIDKYLSLKRFGISKLDFSRIPEIHLKNLARYASMASVAKIVRMNEDKKIATLLCFVKHYETEAIDEVLDLFDLIVSDIILNAKKLGQKRRLRTLKDLDNSALILAEFCHNILFKNNAESRDDKLSLDEMLRLSNLPMDQVSSSINIINDIARPSDNRFSDEMLEQYARVKRFLPNFLKHINFRSTKEGINLTNALKYLKNDFNAKSGYIINKDDAPMQFISRNWMNLVIDKKNDQSFNQKAYILSFVIKMCDLLKRRDVYVLDSNRWNDPRINLLQKNEWEKNKTKICHLLGKSTIPEKETDNISTLMDATYTKVVDGLSDNTAIKIDSSNKVPTLTIENLSKVEDPESLILLRKKVSELLPKISLSELILEIDSHTGFCSEFTHMSEEKARASDMKTSISAVLLSESTNIALESVIKDHIPALTKHRLDWTKQNFIRTETITKSNSKLVDYQNQIPIVKHWGTGEVASADGLRFVVPVKSIKAKANKKYYHSKKGVTWYNFMSDQFAGFHGIVITGTLRDSIFILEGLLEQQTSLSPTEIMTDTSGVSDLVFGLFWLLGYQFSPRLADAGEEKFWRIDKNADYGQLNEIARGVININRIHDNWDDMLRVAGSLKLGRINASVLVRTLFKSDKPSSLTKAIIELGRINKTIYLLNFIDDENYRRKILIQLNRTESRHFVARTICHGRKGEIRRRYRDGQENQLGTLGLITNAVILWNTIYTEKAINYLKSETDFLVRDEDVAKLSPLGHKHLNVLGDYLFELQSNVGNGKLRELNISAPLI